MSKVKSLKRRSTLVASADHTKIFNPDRTGQMEFTACVGSVMSGTNYNTLHRRETAVAPPEVNSTDTIGYCMLVLFMRV